MADEITGKLTFNVSLDGAVIERAESFTFSIVSGNSFTHSIVEVADAGELIVQSADLANGGFCFMKNLSSEYNITVGDVAGDTNHKIFLRKGIAPRGGIAFFEIYGNTIYANTDGGGTAMLEYIIVEY